MLYKSNLEEYIRSKICFFFQQGGQTGPKKFGCNLVPQIRFHLRVALTFELHITGPKVSNFNFSKNYDQKE